MSPLALILIVAAVMLGVGLVAVLAWRLHTSYLNRIERRLARRKGMYRALIGELATHDRALLEPEIRRLGRGLWRGKTGWEKFGRVGFREGPSPAHV